MKKPFYFVGDQNIQQLAQKSCRVSIPGDKQKPSGHTSRQLALDSCI